MAIEDVNLFKELNGKRVQMNDRFETIHVWNKGLALKNNGRYTPKVIDDN